eukprot:4855736-Ditylum_brightwellii.AAC.1
MVAFARAGFAGKALDLLNWCQLYLQVSTLADITSENGRYIVSDIFHCNKICTHSDVAWPHQSKPTKTYWETWESAIRRTFDLKRNCTLPKEFQLGRWLDNTTLT